MKKVFVLLIAVLLIFSFAACGNKDGGGADVQPSGSTDSGASSGGAGESGGGSDLDGALAWWDGEFYGYWVAEKASGGLKNLEGGVWDCYAVIDVDSDGTATMYIWDDEIDIATAKIKIDPEGGIAPMGSAKSIGGEAFDEPLGDADWIILPTYDGYEDYYGNVKFDDFMEIEGVADEDDYLRYTIALRPWGLLWDDVPADQRPPFYEEWYKEGGLYNGSLLDALNDALFNGEAAHIHSALGGGAPSGGGSSGGGSAASGGSADFPILSLTNEQLKEKWNEFRDSHDLWSDIRYDEIVKLLGVEGGVLEDEDTYIEYRWYASDDGSLTVSFSKPSGEFSSSSMNQYGRPD